MLRKILYPISLLLILSSCKETKQPIDVETITETDADGITDSIVSKANIDTLRICTELKEFNGDGQKIAILTRTKWKPGSELTVKFLGGDDFVKSKVKQYAVEWSKHCSIKFKFVTTGNANIRISFVSGGSNSLIGSESLTFSYDPSTNTVFRSNSGTSMNFGWFNSSTSEENFRSTILHEFGHALGLIHEHQAPTANIDWNKPVVYEYYLRTEGWSQPEVDSNVFEKYSASVTQFSHYDNTSIMHYPIPAFLLNTPSQAVDWNTNLSKSDKDFINAYYKIPPQERDLKDPHHGGNEGAGGRGG